MRFPFARTAVLACLMLAALLTVVSPGPAQDQMFQSLGRFTVNPLVSDLPGLARVTDPRLVNPWGMTTALGGLIWVADNGTGLVTSYSRNGVPQPESFTVPATIWVGESSAPTGLVANRTRGFRISDGSVSGPARLIVATEEGTIAGWNPKVDAANAIVQVVETYGMGGSAVFKGLALAPDRAGRQFLYATDFRNNRVLIYDSNWDLVDSFTDTSLPAGFAPFGIRNIGGRLWVTFALQDESGVDDVPGAGNGFVDIFDVDGRLIRRFASDGPLNSPWGMTLAPAGFTRFEGTVLIGNFGDGRINVYDVRTRTFLGQLAQEDGETPLVIDGLWSLDFLGATFGNPFTAGFGRGPNIYFTAGINDEQDGLFGTLRRFRANSPFGPR